MTKEEFEKGYAERSGVPIEWFHAHDHHGIPCDCAEDGCPGWRMAYIPPSLPDINHCKGS